MPFLVTDLATAELAKTAANAFLATKLSFINAMAEVCEATGADVVELAQVLAYDIPDRRSVPGSRSRIRRRMLAQRHPRLRRHRTPTRHHLYRHCA